MRIETLIRYLNTARRKHGNIPVFIDDEPCYEDNVVKNIGRVEVANSFWTINGRPEKMVILDLGENMNTGDFD